jgi:hypothetical protein
MRKRTLILLISVMMIFNGSAGIQIVNAHGGGLDSQGGHNCRVGSCAGTYHCHQARGPGCGGGTPARVKVVPDLPDKECYAGNGADLTSGNIALVQSKLKDYGFSAGTADGKLGTRTMQSINKFERKYKLKKSVKNSIYISTLNLLGASC